MRPLRLGFLASGNGSSAEAMVTAIGRGQLSAEARLLVSNRKSAPALTWASACGVPAVAIPTVGDPDVADRALADAMTDAGVDLIVLSGYLRRLGPAVLARYANRIVNIHPGPLPQFGGEGMYGARVHDAVIAAGVPESAIVIHLVDEEYDHGAELARRSVPVLAGDTPQALEDRVKAMEPAFFLETVQRIAKGQLELPQAIA